MSRRGLSIWKIIIESLEMMNNNWTQVNNYVNKLQLGYVG